MAPTRRSALPSGHDPKRNPHRQASAGAWSRSAVRAILTNPTYTGRRVWAKQRWDESRLFDLDNPSMGQRRRMVWNDPEAWIKSTELAHEPLVDPETFAAAQQQKSLGRDRETVQVPRKKRVYPCSGIVFHCCGRRMGGHHNGRTAYYRRRVDSEYPGIDHAKNVTIPERVITRILDGWLARLFDPDHLDETVAAMTAAQQPDHARDARVEDAQRRILEADGKLARYRAALEAGTDPVLVAGWTREVQADRARAEQVILGAPASQSLTRDEVASIVGAFQAVAARLANAAPEVKAGVYQQLGVTPPSTTTVASSWSPVRDRVGLQGVSEGVSEF